ncbi:hypothetical protein [Streptomyces syringium]|uniref:hypothetical protein n=1 Tax=Streptomyces syringium TaxID=76729 RepID=UPI0033FE2130
MKLQNLLAKARRRGDRVQARMLRQQMTSLPSSDPNDPGYRRTRYIRYADDHLLGCTGPKSEAEQIKRRPAEFLRDQLKLKLSQDKTLINHARTRLQGFSATRSLPSTTTRRRRAVTVVSTVRSLSVPRWR